MQKIFFVLVTFLPPLATPTFGQWCPGGVCPPGGFAGGWSGGWGGGPSLMATGFGENRERWRIGPLGGMHYHRRERGFGDWGGGGFRGGWGGGVQSYAAPAYERPMILGSGGWGGGVATLSGGCYGGGVAQSYSLPTQTLSSTIPERIISYQIVPPKVSEQVVSVPRYYPLSAPQSAPPKSSPVPQKTVPSPQDFTSPTPLPPAMMRLPIPTKPEPQTPPPPPPPAAPPEQARFNETQDLRATDAAPPPPLVTSTQAHHRIPSVFADLPIGTVVYHDGRLFTIEYGFMRRR